MSPYLIFGRLAVATDRLTRSALFFQKTPDYAGWQKFC